MTGSPAPSASAAVRGDDPAPSDPAPAAPRFAGLDGLRAIAVGLVLVYHLAPPLLPGGYLGVDLFFVISGFLITSLLLREGMRTRASLVGFWRRRARRLLPALAAMVLVSTSLALLVGGDVLYRIGVQLVGAATFSYNWWTIAAGGGYFDATAPELFRNVWSLAVEEQFYLVWPLALVAILRIPRAGGRMAVALTGAAVSIAALLLLATAGADPSRIYYGTDTHAFGLLLGAALAFAVGARAATAAGTPTRRDRVLTAVVGATALAGLLVVAAVRPAGDLGLAVSLIAASVLGLVAIAAAVRPGSPLGPALDHPVLRWIGERSYGIYLWHWPLLVLALAASGRPGPEAGVPPVLAVGVLGATIAVAAASHRFLEAPVRRLGFREAARRFGAALRSGGARASRAVGATLVALGLVAATGAAVAIAPPETSAGQAISAGQSALDRASAPDASVPDGDPDPAPVGPGVGPTTPGPSASSESADTTPPAASSEPAPSTSPEPVPTVAGARVDAIGDSVMLAAAPSLLARLPGIRIDAQVSRSMYVGPDLVAPLAASGALRDYVVVALGTNGPVERSTIESIIDLAGSTRTVVLVTAFAERDWIPGVNATLTAVAAAHHDVVLADWAGSVTGHLDELAGDGIHPDSDGGARFAAVVAGAIDAAEAERLARIEAGRVRVLIQEDRLASLPPPVGVPTTGAEESNRIPPSPLRGAGPRPVPAR